MSAFGFGGDSEEDDEEYDSSLPTYAAQPPATSPQPAPTVTAVTETESDGLDETDSPHDDGAADNTATEEKEEDAQRGLTDTQLPADLFDAVIELFNANQPDFVKKCLSLDAQRQYIIDTISDNLRCRILRAVGPSEADRLKKRVEVLEIESQNVNAIRTENRKLHLSIERQKRAMLDRINDLESQVSQHHAEKEKMLSARFSHDVQAIAGPTATHDDNVITISEHENIIEEQKSIIAGRDARISELDKTVDDLKEQLANQSVLREQLEVKNRMSDEMINDLRNRAASERHELEETCRQQEIALGQIQQQVENFEQVKARLENRIVELKEALQDDKRAEREAQIARLSQENASLRHTIENNLYNQANSEMRLRSEIKQLKLELEKALAANQPVEPAPSPLPPMPSAPIIPEDALGEDEMFPPERRPRQAKRRGRPRKQKVEDELDNTDWFNGPGGHKDDPDFGYHEPPRRPSNDNEAQLSLF